MSRNTSARLLVAAAGFVLALAVWQGLTAAIGELTMPSPLSTARHIADNIVHSAYLDSHRVGGTSYLQHLLYTTRNVVVGLTIGTVVGVSVGMASVLFRSIGEIANSIMAAFGAAPIFVAAPFFLVWFGIVSGAQILLVTFYSGLLMYLFARRAAANVDAEYVEFALSLGSTRWSILSAVYLPASVPELLGGLRIALAGAWGIEAIAELLGSQQGIGFLIKIFSAVYVVQAMLALVVVLGIMAVIWDRLFVLGAARLTTWTEAGRHAQMA